MLTTPSNLIHLFLSVIKGFTGMEKHMYILQNKSQLNSFVNSIREQSLASFRFSPKPAKLKEIVSRCLGFNSYADAISKLPIDTEEFDYTFPKVFAETLMIQPYSLSVDVGRIKAIYDNAISSCAYWDDDRALMSIHMATDGM